MNLLRKSATSVVWEFSSKFSKQGAQFLISIVLTRLLEPADFGLIGIVMVFVVLLNLLIDSGLSQVVIQKSKETQEDYNILFSINLLTGIVLFIGLNLSAPFIATWYDLPQLRFILHLLSFLLPLYSITVVYDTWLRKNLEFKAIGIALFFSTAVSGVVGVVLAFLQFGVWSLVVQALLSAVVLVVVKSMMSRLQISFVFSVVKMRTLLREGRGFFLTSLFYKLNDRLDIFFIGRFVSAEFLGYYTRAKTFKNLIILNTSSTINSVLFPLLSKVKDDEASFRQYVRLSNDFVNFLAAALTGFLLISSDFFFLLLFGRKWLPAVPIFQFLCLGGYFMAVTAIYYNVLRSLGRSGLLAKIGIYETSVNLLIFGSWLLFDISFEILLTLMVFNSFTVFVLHLIFTSVLLRWRMVDQLVPFFKNCIVFAGIYYLSFSLTGLLDLDAYFGSLFFVVLTAIYLFVFRLSDIRTALLYLKDREMFTVNE